MRQLVDFESGGRRLFFTSSGRLDDCVMLYEGSSYDALCAGVERRVPFAKQLSEHGGKLVRRDEIKPDRFLCPLLPADPRDVMVSSFGNTHRYLNGGLISDKAVDWFYKGIGDTLQTTGEPVRLPMQTYGGGIEVEYAIAYVADKNGNLAQVGYTLALDLSDVELRKRHPNLAPISKLMNTVLAKELILSDEIPKRSLANCMITKSGACKWAADGVLGRDNMKFTVQYLQDILIRDRRFPPFSVHYILIGAAISTHKGGYAMTHGDSITAHSNRDDLYIECDYEEETVIFSCC